MKKSKFEMLPYETNLPPGKGAELALAAMDPWELHQMGRETLLFARRCMADPKIREAVAAKVEQLRAEGFFEKYPPKPRKDVQNEERYI